MQNQEEKLINEAAISKDADRLYEIAQIGESSVVRQTLARNPSIDSRSMYLLGDQIQIMLDNESFKKTTDPEQDIFCPEVAMQLFTDSSDETITALAIPKDSKWWEYVLGHPSPRVRRAIAKNRNLPERLLPTITVLEDSSTKLGYIENPAAKPEILTVLTLTSEPSSNVRVMAKKRINSISKFSSNFEPTGALAIAKPEIEETGDLIIAKNKPKNKAKKTPKKNPLHLFEGNAEFILIGFGGIVFLGLSIMAAVMFTSPKQEQVPIAQEPVPMVVEEKPVVTEVPPPKYPTSISKYEYAMSLLDRVGLAKLQAKRQSDWAKIALLIDSAIAEFESVEPATDEYLKAQKQAQSLKVEIEKIKFEKKL